MHSKLYNIITGHGITSGLSRIYEIADSNFHFVDTIVFERSELIILLSFMKKHEFGFWTFFLGRVGNPYYKNTYNTICSRCFFGFALCSKLYGLQTIDGFHLPISLIKLVVTWFDSLWMQQSFVSDSAVFSAFKSKFCNLKIGENLMALDLRFKWSSIIMTLYEQLWLPSNNSNECLWFLLSIVSCSHVSWIWIFDILSSLDSL